MDRAGDRTTIACRELGVRVLSKLHRFAVQHASTRVSSCAYLHTFYIQGPRSLTSKAVTLRRRSNEITILSIKTLNRLVVDASTEVLGLSLINSYEQYGIRSRAPGQPNVSEDPRMSRATPTQTTLCSIERSACMQARSKSTRIRYSYLDTVSLVKAMLWQ